jgi:hypothetical protein
MTPLSIWAAFYSKMVKMGVKRWGNFESFPNVRLNLRYITFLSRFFKKKVLKRFDI